MIALKNRYNRLYLFLIVCLMIWDNQLKGLANLTYNDPYPFFTAFWPYSYLTERQKAQLMQFEYAYPDSRFMIHVSGYRQAATFGRNKQRDAVNLGDLPNGRWNMLSFFWDPVMAQQLFNYLNITFSPTPTSCNPPMDPTTCTPTDTLDNCYCLITQPDKSDPNKEFGFFTIPMLYRKYGVRFESELLLINRCFYSVGLKIQTGVANITQRILGFTDLTCQALGVACPAAVSGTFGTPADPNCPVPNPANPVPVAVPYIDQAANPIPPCPALQPCVPVGPTTPSNCVELPQTFKPCCNETLCLSFDGETKQVVIENIMKKKNIIFGFLGLKPESIDTVGLEDFRLILFWRRIWVINEEDEFYPRLIFMPWAEAGAALPLGKSTSEHKPFALPIGNNDHVSTGFTAGFTFGYLDTIDLNFKAGFTRFFEKDYCNYRMPTNPKESGIYPYAADVKRRPGTTWEFGAALNAYRFIDNLSFWFEYQILQHRRDDIKVCRSFIPSTSKYFKQGFLVDLAEDDTAWEAQVINIAFTYDLSPFLTAGIFWQAPVKQRNAYWSGTVLGSLTFIY